MGLIYIYLTLLNKITLPFKWDQHTSSHRMFDLMQVIIYDIWWRLIFRHAHLSARLCRQNVTKLFTLLHSSYILSPTNNMSGCFIRRHACVIFIWWPFWVEMLTAHGGPAYDSDRGASSKGVLLRCQLCLQAVYKLLMYSKAQMCPPAPDMTHRSPIHALCLLFINTAIVSISGGGGRCFIVLAFVWSWTPHCLVLRSVS